MANLPPFDELIKMSHEELEELRNQMVANVIDQAPDRLKRKLNGLQFKIDSTIRISKNEIDSCIRVSRMMHDSFHELKDALNGKFEVEENNCCDVLEFNVKES